jgi:hypothetical protein
VPDPGRARHEDYLVDLPGERSVYPPLPWVCPNSTMINVYFEVLKAPLLDRLPPEFCRTSPPYCRLSIFDHPDSPVGPFRDAILALGCRLNMMPAAFVAASVTNNEKALAAGLFERGFPNTLGKIEFVSGVTSACAVVSDATGSLLEVELPLLQTIEPSRLAFDHADSLRTTADGNTVLTITRPDINIQQAAICKNARIEYAGERPQTAWHTLRCRNVVSAQLVHGDRTFDAGHAPG